MGVGTWTYNKDTNLETYDEYSFRSWKALLHPVSFSSQVITELETLAIV